MKMAHRPIVSGSIRRCGLVGVGVSLGAALRSQMLKAGSVSHCCLPILM